MIQRKQNCVIYSIHFTAEPSLAAITHPFHIHGHNFYILEQGIFKKPMVRSLENLQARLMLPRNISDFLPAKDTVTVPANGYAVVRVLADNPGKLITRFYLQALKIKKSSGHLINILNLNFISLYAIH